MFTVHVLENFECSKQWQKLAEIFTIKNDHALK